MIGVHGTSPHEAISVIEIRGSKSAISRYGRPFESDTLMELSTPRLSVITWRLWDFHLQVPFNVTTRFVPVGAPVLLVLGMAELLATKAVRFNQKDTPSTVKKLESGISVRLLLG